MATRVSHTTQTLQARVAGEQHPKIQIGHMAPSRNKLKRRINGEQTLLLWASSSWQGACQARRWLEKQQQHSCPPAQSNKIKWTARVDPDESASKLRVHFGTPLPMLKKWRETLQFMLSSERKHQPHRSESHFMRNRTIFKNNNNNKSAGFAQVYESRRKDRPPRGATKQNKKGKKRQHICVGSGIWFHCAALSSLLRTVLQGEKAHLCLSQLVEGL